MSKLNIIDEYFNILHELYNDSFNANSAASSTIINKNITPEKQYYDNVSAYIRTTILLISKTLGADRTELNNIAILPLRDTITNLSITTNIYTFGTTATMIAASSNNNLYKLLEGSEEYHVVIHYTLYDSEDSPIYLEPYIFEIEEVKLLGAGESSDVISISLNDVFSSAMKKHSWTSLVKWNNAINNSHSYSSLIESIFNYIKRVIELETNDIYEINKDVRVPLNDTFSSAEIVSNTIKNIPYDASIFEAMNIIWKDMVVSVDFPESFMGAGFEMFKNGNIVSKAFVLEEYNDIAGLYGNESKSIFSFEHVDSKYIKRFYNMRSLYLPFKNAFTVSNSQNASGSVWEVINRPADISKITHNKDFSVLSNFTNTTISDYKKYPVDPKLAFKGWKNYIYQSESTICGGKGQLVFFNWVKSLFNYSYLGFSDTKPYFSSYINPGFAQLETKVDRDMKSASVLNFNESNTAVKHIYSDDFEQEIYVNIAKELSSFVMWGNEYQMSISGNFLRRPNEIVQLYAPKYADVNENADIITDMFENNFTMLYISSVSHTLDAVNNRFSNIIYSLRPCHYVK